jgi:hypothetical protein
MKVIRNCVKLRESRRSIGAAVVALVMSAGAMAQNATDATPSRGSGPSPALCGRGDVREPGIQGDVPAGQTPHYNCGVKLIGQFPAFGAVAGTGNCVYVRYRGPGTTPDESQITVLDVRDPTKPTAVGAPLPVHNGSETLRAVVTKNRAIMVSGSTVFDISDCMHPRHLGEINWPDTAVPGVTRKNLPHDIRINREGTRVFASFGVWEIDLTNLSDSKTWKVIDRRCEVAAQIPGPWQEIHRQSIRSGHSLCDDATKPAPRGANYGMGSSPLQASLLWPVVSHSLDFNTDDSRLYVADQAGGTSALWAPQTKLRIFDLTQNPIKLIGETNGPGHGLDWFKVGGREYVIHSNEHSNHPEDSCNPYPRSTALGWACEAIISDVTDPTAAKNVSMVQLAINNPESCEAKKASKRDVSLAYHLIDNPMNAKFAALNFDDAGLRIFDIRNPLKPTEIA